MVVDNEDARDELRLDRFLSNMDASQSLVNTVMEGVFTIAGGTTASSATYSFANIKAISDFVNFSNEFNLFRVKGIKFEVYDTVPNSQGTAYWATYHIAEGQTAPSTLGSITALVDLRIVPPGDGKTTLTWVPTGTKELQFQSANSTGTSIDYGGLVVYTPASTAPAPSRWYVVVKAHVQFRMRV